MRIGLWLCSALTGALAFAWPLAVSSDPADPLFKPVAIAAFCAFLALLALACKARLTSS